MKLSNDFKFILMYSFVQNKLQIQVTTFLRSNLQAKRIQFSENDTSNKERYEKHWSFQFSIELLTGTKFPCNSKEEQSLPDPQSHLHAAKRYKEYVLSITWQIWLYEIYHSHLLPLNSIADNNSTTSIWEGQENIYNKIRLGTSILDFLSHSYLQYTNLTIQITFFSQNTCRTLSCNLLRLQGLLLKDYSAYYWCNISDYYNKMSYYYLLLLSWWTTYASSWIIITFISLWMDSIYFHTLQNIYSIFMSTASPQQRAGYQLV